MKKQLKHNYSYLVEEESKKKVLFPFKSSFVEALTVQEMFEKGTPLRSGFIVPFKGSGRHSIGGVGQDTTNCSLPFSIFLPSSSNQQSFHRTK